MASASSSSAKNLFHDSKRRLADRVVGTVNNAASVGRQIVRGSRSNDVSVNEVIFIKYISKSKFQTHFFTDSNACSQKFCTTRNHHGKYVPKFEENGIIATTYGIPMRFNHRKFQKN